MTDDVRRSDAADPKPRPSSLLLITLAVFTVHELFGAFTTLGLDGPPASGLAGSALQLAGVVLLALGLLGREEGQFVLRPRRPVLGIALVAYTAGLFLQSLGPAPFAGLVLLGSYPFALPALVAWRDLGQTRQTADAPQGLDPLAIDPRGYPVSVVVGLAVAATVPVFTALAGGTVPEWIPQLTWLGVAILGSAGLGYLFPIGAIRWALIILAVQPLVVLVAGGAFAAFIIAGFCLILSPFAILGGRFGASLKEKALYSAGSAP